MKMNQYWVLLENCYMHYMFFLMVLHWPIHTIFKRSHQMREMVNEKKYFYINSLKSITYILLTVFNYIVLKLRVELSNEKGTISLLFKSTLTHLKFGSSEVHHQVNKKCLKLDFLEKRIIENNSMSLYILLRWATPYFCKIQTPNKHIYRSGIRKIYSKIVLICLKKIVQWIIKKNLKIYCQDHLDKISKNIILQFWLSNRSKYVQVKY